ncbi:hypothetical protein C9J01_18760 [Photobacterium rosenbergii]|uniref:Uncharacterized protein n=1 Tax=Photobacterium rosenbergii TaxID=294936 RepID=A0A2T3N9S6_9GAMM|nr:hypothetical protein [Photobacterium rosenbergii]PSW10255.1 hypothetical protein C9J01_18760 [Photobacterium rosenbergii]
MYKARRLEDYTRCRNLFIRIKNTAGDKSVFFDDLEDLANETDDEARLFINEAIDLVTSSTGDDQEEAAECVITDFDNEIEELRNALLIEACSDLPVEDTADVSGVVETESYIKPQQETKTKFRTVLEALDEKRPVDEEYMMYKNHPLYARSIKDNGSIASYWLLWVYMMYLEASKNPMAKNNIHELGVRLWGENQVRSSKLLNGDAGSAIDVDIDGRITGFFGKGYIGKQEFLNILLFAKNDSRLAETIEKICKIGLKSDLEQMMLSPFLIRMYKVTDELDKPEFRFSMQFIKSAEKEVHYGRRSHSALCREANAAGYKDLDSASRKYYSGMYNYLRKSEYSSGVRAKPSPKPLIPEWGKPIKQPESPKPSVMEPEAVIDQKPINMTDNNESVSSIKIDDGSKSEMTTNKKLFNEETQEHRSVYLALNTMQSIGRMYTIPDIAQFSLVDETRIPSILSELQQARLVHMNGNTIVAVQQPFFVWG